MTVTTTFMKLFLKLGFFDLMRSASPNTLTVLNYHRIDDPTRPGFNTFKPNVSATPAQFEEQMDYLSQKYNPVSGRDIAEWLHGGRKLPPNAALVTFDDGYYDNLQHAYPVLKARNIPAIIFLTTNHIDSSVPFYWDFVAYCFDNTTGDDADFPLFGSRHWYDAGSRNGVMVEWMTWAKTLPETEKQKQVDCLPEVLNVSVPDDLSAGLTLTWSDVRHLSANGIEMGSHTLNHPILTRIGLDEAKKELELSKKQIEAETNLPVVSFAYPNGHRPDFNQDVVECVRQTGYQVAFTLLSGLSSYKVVRESPLTIRRIFIGYRDSFPRFVGKLMGVSRFNPKSDAFLPLGRG